MPLMLPGKTGSTPASTATESERQHRAAGREMCGAALPRCPAGAPVMVRNRDNFPTLVAVANATLGDPDANNSEKAGASVVLALGRGEPLTPAEIDCALARVTRCSPFRLKLYFILFFDPGGRPGPHRF